jgi:LysM repeat protein
MIFSADGGAAGGNTKPKTFITIKDAGLKFTGLTKHTKKIYMITIHHTAGAHATPQQIHQWHIARDFGGAGYHYYVQKDGTIWILRPDIYQGCHVTNRNNGNIGLCFEGDFTQETMTQTQLDAGAKAVAYLLQKFDLKTTNVLPHYEATAGSTACPGFRRGSVTWNFLLSQAGSIAGEKTVTTSNVSDSGSASSSTTDTETPSFPAPGFGYYSVKSGDSLYSISQRLGISVDTLKDLNGVGDDNIINPGQSLKYPTNVVSKYTKIADDYARIASGIVEAAVAFSHDTQNEEQTYKAAVAKITSPSVQYETANTTLRGGKSRALWEHNAMLLPGYRNACMVITKPDNTTYVIQFMVSPSNASDARTNNVQTNKTTAGWFIYKLGPGLTQVNFSGYMLDIKNQLERHAFLEDYKHYVVDKQLDNHTFTNEYTVKLYLEGIEYEGYIVNLAFQKSSVQPFLYNYNIQFLVIDDKYVHDPLNSLKNTVETISSSRISVQSLIMSASLHSTLTLSK